MRKQRTTTIPLAGQILFAEESSGTITLDCLLTRAGSDAASIPVTLEARFSDRSLAAAAIDLLGDLAERASDVEVRIHDGARGPEVEIISGIGRLVLEPEA